MTMASGPIGYAVAAVIAVAVLLAPFHRVEEVELFFTREPLTYEQTFFNKGQVRGFCFPWVLCNNTEVQYGLKNTDDAPGDFNVNFLFKSDSKVAARTIPARVIPGEEVVVVAKSPLRGESEVTVNVLVPTKDVPHERTVVKHVNTFSKLPDLLRLRRLR